MPPVCCNHHRPKRSSHTHLRNQPTSTQQDADSLDVATGQKSEGAFYVWTYDEVCVRARMRVCLCVCVSAMCWTCNQRLCRLLWLGLPTFLLIKPQPQPHTCTHTRIIYTHTHTPTSPPPNHTPRSWLHCGPRALIRPCSVRCTTSALEVRARVCVCGVCCVFVGVRVCCLETLKSPRLCRLAYR